MVHSGMMIQTGISIQLGRNRLILKRQTTVFSGCHGTPSSPISVDQPQLCTDPTSSKPWMLMLRTDTLGLPSTIQKINSSTYRQTSTPSVTTQEHQNVSQQEQVLSPGSKTPREQLFQIPVVKTMISSAKFGFGTRGLITKKLPAGKYTYEIKNQKKALGRILE